MELDDERLRPLTLEEIAVFKNTQTISERVTSALFSEFFSQEEPIKITEEEILKGYRQFKYMLEDFMPHLF